MARNEEMTMRLPEMTPLQFVAVSLLFAGPTTAADLRGRLCRWRRSCNRTAFSRLMRRVETAGYVEAGWRADETGGRTVLGRVYQVTDLGVIMWKAAREFYEGFDPPGADLEVACTDLAQYAAYDPKERKGLLVRDITEELVRAFDGWRRRR